MWRRAIPPIATAAAGVASAGAEADAPLDRKKYRDPSHVMDLLSGGGTPVAGRAGPGFVRLAEALSTPASTDSERRRLVPRGLRPVAAAVVFRHGARTTLSKLGKLPEATWDMCGGAADDATDSSTRRGVSLRLVKGDGRHSTGEAAAAEARGLPPPQRSPHVDRQSRSLLPGGCALGQLTPLGAAQARALGTVLRERYGDAGMGLLGESGVPGAALYARSSNVPRTLETLQQVLTELLPGEASDVVVWGVDADDEFLYPNAFGCARLMQLYKAARAQHRGAVGVDEAALRREVGALLRVPPGEVNFVAARDALVARAAHGLPVPAGVTPAVHRRVDAAAVQQIARLMWRNEAGATARANEALSLGIGRLVDHLLGKLKAALASDSAGEAGAPRLMLYSAHDTALMPLLAALSGANDEWPGFCSWVAVEVFVPVNTDAGADGTAGVGGVDAGDVFVRIVHDGRQLPHRGGSPAVARLRDVEAALRHLVPTDYRRQCEPAPGVLGADGAARSSADSDGTQFK